MFSKLKIKIMKPQRTQRHEGDRKNWPRSSEFFFHGEKRWWVAPADPESKPRLKLFSRRRANLRKGLSCREIGGRYHESLCSLCVWIPQCPGGPYDKQDLSCDRYCVRFPVSPARVGIKHRSLKFCLGSLSLRQSIQQIKLSVPT